MKSSQMQCCGLLAGQVYSVLFDLLLLCPVTSSYLSTYIRWNTLYYHKGLEHSRCFYSNWRMRLGHGDHQDLHKEGILMDSCNGWCVLYFDL